MPPPPGACPARPLRRQATRSRLENVTGSFCSRRLLQIPIRCRKREAKQNQAAERSPSPTACSGHCGAWGRHVAPVGRAAGLGSPSSPRLPPLPLQVLPTCVAPISARARLMPLRGERGGDIMGSGGGDGGDCFHPAPHTRMGPPGPPVQPHWFNPFAAREQLRNHPLWGRRWALPSPTAPQ